MPRSRVEYATDNITIYRSCPYACAYCWAWRNTLFSNRIRRGRYDPLEEAKKYARSKIKRTIVISFTSDPYPPQEADLCKTRNVLKILSRTRHKIMILTKNPTLALRDLDIIERGNIWLGTTIIDITDKARLLERNAPNPLERIRALEFAKKSRKVKTWISLEPIIPGISYPWSIVDITKDFIDFYVLGSFNYSKRLGFNISEQEKKQWYREHVKKAIIEMTIWHKQYFIKKELRKYLDD